MGQSLSRYGLEGLKEKPHSGRPHRLTGEQKSELKEYVIEHAVNDSGGRLQARDIRLYIEVIWIHHIKSRHSISYYMTSV